MNNNYEELYLKLEKDFSKETSTADEIDKLYKLMQELESQQNNNIEIQKILVNLYLLL